MSPAWPKTPRIEADLRERIESGRFGAVGAVFMTTRELAEREEISLRTAHRVLVALRESGALKLDGRRFRVAKVAPAHVTGGGRIGVLVTNLENPFFASLVKALEEQASRRGFSLEMASSNYDSGKEAEILARFFEQRLDGILVCPWQSSAEVYASIGAPLVFMARSVENVPVDAVLVHNFFAGEVMARHFLEQGIERFAYVGLDALPHDRRLGGFLEGLRRSGIEIPGDRIFRGNASGGVIPGLEKFLGTVREPLGIFCFHDLLAAAVLRTCALCERRVPEEVAVAGFDDLPLAAELHPSLTSVAYPVDQMASMALDRLQVRISESEHERVAPVTLHVEAHLVPRESTLRQVWAAPPRERSGRTPDEGMHDMIYHSV